MTLADLQALSIKLLQLAQHEAWRQVQQHPWTVIAGGYAAARAFGVVIQSGQRGVLFRWGRAVKELEPGFHWLIPLVHGVKITPVRSVTIELPGQKVQTADGLVYEVGVNLVYHVEEATKAMTLVDHVDAGCRAAIPIVVFEVIRVRNQAELLDRASLDAELTERLRAFIARWGLAVEHAGFMTIAPDSSATRTTQLRLKTRERAGAVRSLMAGGLDPASSLILAGSVRQPVGRSSHRYHRRPGKAALHRKNREKPTPAPPTDAKSEDAVVSSEKNPAVKPTRPAPPWRAKKRVKTL